MLRPGGLLVFNVWDRLAENELADVTTNALESVFPTTRPFSGAHPHGYHDAHSSGRTSSAGFLAAPQTATVTARSRADRADPAIAYCQGRRCATKSARGASRLVKPRTRQRSDRGTLRSRARRREDSGARGLVERSGAWPIDRRAPTPRRAAHRRDYPVGAAPAAKRRGCPTRRGMVTKRPLRS